MSDRMLMAMVLLLPVAGVCGILVIWRARRWSARRQEAEQRSALAMEEMQLFTAQLRADYQAARESLTPGERLEQRYSSVPHGVVAE